MSIGKLTRALFTLLSLGVISAFGLELVNNGVSRYIDSIRTNRTPNKSDYKGINAVNDFKREVVVYDNGIIISKPDYQVKIIDSTQNGIPDYYGIIFRGTSNEVPNDIMWYRKDLFNETFSGFLKFADSQINILQEGSSLTNKLNEDYSTLKSNGLPYNDAQWASARKPLRELELPYISQQSIIR